MLSATLLMPSAVAEETQRTKLDIRTAFRATEVKIEVDPKKESFTAQWEYTNPHELPLVIEKIKSRFGRKAA